jgi:hypothetical protein
MDENTAKLLGNQKQHLASLLEAMQRCVYFLNASDSAVAWPLNGLQLQAEKKNVDIFESLAAINERFAKLQDTLGAAMRHSLQLSGEQADSFIKVLSIFEKSGVVSSIENWQLARAARNLAAHDYETDYAQVALHFNTLHELTPELYATALRFIQYSDTHLHIQPEGWDFSDDFYRITATQPSSSS